MATIQYLENRIVGKQKEIEKLQAKLERIKKAQATNWEVNPYYYGEDDLKWTAIYLERANSSLEELRQKLMAETEKANSRNVKALVDFLENWKNETIAYFLEQKTKYDEALKELMQTEDEYFRWFKSERWHAGEETAKSRSDAHRKAKKAFTERWSHVLQFNHGDQDWETTMRKDIEIEKNRKYDNIIQRVNSEVGQITDACGLTIGINADLNGVIIGERGAVKIETIGAGGYNIQRYHFRVLIHKF